MLLCTAEYRNHTRNMEVEQMWNSRTKSTDLTPVTESTDALSTADSSGSLLITNMQLKALKRESSGIHARLTRLHERLERLVGSNDKG